MNTIIDILVGSEATAGRLALIEIRLQPGSEPPYHRHFWEDELLYVLEGELALFMEDKWLPLPAGQAILVPRGVEHTFAVQSETVRLLTVFTPAGFDGFYREVGAATAGGQREANSLERWVATAARYGCEITGPHPGQPEKLF